MIDGDADQKKHAKPSMATSPMKALSLALLAFAFDASAQDAEVRRRGLIEQAAVASREGDHRAAIALLTRAGAIRVTPALRLVLAQEEQLDARPVEAFEDASRCLDELATGSADEGRARVEAECRSIVNALRGRVGRLRVVTPAPAPPGLRVEVGGDVVAPARLVDPLTLAPGVVRVTASASDGTRFDALVTITGGGDSNVTVALAPPSTVATTAPVTPAASVTSNEVGSVALGGGGVCVRLVGGRVLCRGAVGTASSFAPVSDVAGASSLVVGWSHACAVVLPGRVRCWGERASGAVGEGESGAASVAVRDVMGAVGVSAGGEHTCATLEDGRVTCWGANNGGQLGDGTTTRRERPAFVEALPPAAEVCAGPTFTCARLRDGTASCWGNNSSRQVSPSSEGFLTRPRVVEGATRLVQLVVAADAACGLRDDGTVWCWGGDLGGYGLTRVRSGPHVAQVPGLAGVAEIAAGREHVCARTRSGAVLCWGTPEGGVLGAVRVAQPFVPRRVGPMPPAAALAAGAARTCALGRDGVLRCWGLLPAAREGQGDRVVTRPEPLRLPTS